MTDPEIETDAPDTDTDTPDTDAPAVDAADIRYLNQAIALAASAREAGDHPFGALVTTPDGTIVATARNRVVTGSDLTGHAETELIRTISRSHNAAERAEMTLYTSTEPCAMCAGAIYWSGICTVVYALSEDGLRALTGTDPKNPSMSLPCREVFSHGARPIEVRGPVDIAAATDVHAGFWEP